MRISDWSSDVCSSDLPQGTAHRVGAAVQGQQVLPQLRNEPGRLRHGADRLAPGCAGGVAAQGRQGDRGLWQPHLPQPRLRAQPDHAGKKPARDRSEEHTSELQSLMRISYAVFCLKKKTIIYTNSYTTT